jgi:uncharacterized protein YjbI with pentapeptide repeats
MHSNWDAAVAIESTWEGADASGASLRCANLSRADLSGADLTRADLHGLVDEAATWSRAKLAGARRTDPELLAAEAWLPPDLDEADGAG